MRRFLTALLCAAVLVGIPISAGSQSLDQPSPLPISTNRFFLWVHADGRLGARYGFYSWPAGGLGSYPVRGASAVFTDDLLWGGVVRDTGSGDLRVSGIYFTSALVRGAITSPGVAEDTSLASVRVYRIRRDWETADLRGDVAELLNRDPASVTDQEIATLRSRYGQDWTDWPVPKGAPFDDADGDGQRDPGENPGLHDADMVLWCVVNDLSPQAQNTLYSSAPSGMEVQVTVWAYSGANHALGNAVFERYRFIYKGTSLSPPGSIIRDMYITKHADTDLGSIGDDLLGCDTILQLGYTYNGNEQDISLLAAGVQVPPALGYTLLQGPVVPAAPGESAWFMGGRRTGYRNLPLSSIIGKGSGSPIASPPFTPEGAFRMYRWMQGFIPDPSGTPLRPYLNPDTTETKFTHSGDPVAGTGALDGTGTSMWSLPPGDRRTLLSAGPFSMALGDTQEVVYAVAGAWEAQSRLQNIALLKTYTNLLRQAYPDLASLRVYQSVEHPPAPGRPATVELYQNFPNPFNPGTTITYALPDDGRVRLIVYDMLGRQVKVLEDAAKTAGRYTAVWDGQDEDGKAVAAGAYVYRFTAGGMSVSKRMMMMR